MADAARTGKGPKARTGQRPPCQDLYREFIREASKAYIDALQHDKADISALVGTYAKISMMRVLSASSIVESIDQVGRKIVDTYLQPDKVFSSCEMIANGQIDLLRDFSQICREECDSEQF